MNTTAMLLSTTKVVKPIAPTTQTADAIASLFGIGEAAVAPKPAPKNTLGRKILNGLGLLGAAALAVGAAAAGSTILGVAPWAHADPVAFNSTTGHTGYQDDHDPIALWTDITQTTPIKATVQQTALLAQSICVGRQNGETEDQAIMIGVRNAGLSLADATYDVDSAEFHYCSSLW